MFKKTYENMSRQELIDRIKQVERERDCVIAQGLSVIDSLRRIVHGNEGAPTGATIAPAIYGLNRSRGLRI